MRTIHIFGELETKRIIANSYNIDEDKITIRYEYSKGRRKPKLVVEVEVYNDDRKDS